ncbi:MAG: hypothetical protein UY09_C0005G0023 [Parcubacteria group bacterium GW2011_GWA2_47_8]|nr:MAG: hypothetical protein UY09_C0005G0023 [Parcubacteria group bacterium GW2011_GWA2_47_8]
MKKLAILSVAAMGILIGAYAAQASSDVVLTFTNTNNATVTNTSEVDAETGDNEQEADQDLEGGEIVTGNAQAGSSIENDVNYNNTDVEVQNASDVTATVDNVNNAVAINLSDIWSSSGGNEQEADQDVLGARIQTGSVVGVSSIRNGKTGLFGLGFNANIAKFVIGTVNPSCACLSVASDVELTVDNDNYAEVTNTTEVDAESGDNEQEAEQDLGGCTSCGTDGAEIVTGDVQAGSSIENDVNYNETDGEIVAGSDITATVTNDNTTDPLNSSEVEGNSGDNEQEADQDLTGGSQNTGNVTAVDSIINIINRVLNKFKSG